MDGNNGIRPLTPEEARITQVIRSLKLGDFRPFAQFNPQLDQLEVVVRDCSTTERGYGRDGFIVRLYDNYPGPNENPLVGFHIVGVKWLCHQYNIRTGCNLYVGSLLDALRQKNLISAEELIDSTKLLAQIRDPRVFIPA